MLMEFVGKWAYFFFVVEKAVCARRASRKQPFQQQMSVYSGICAGYWLAMVVLS
jgi:hypothetical protein